MTHTYYRDDGSYEHVDFLPMEAAALLVPGRKIVGIQVGDFRNDNGSTTSKIRVTIERGAKE